ncbi:MAG: DUF4384 domain-containing protein [Pseudomonadota bacterium]
MTVRILFWFAAVPASVSLHAAAAVGLMASLTPEPPPEQAVPESRFDLQTVQVAARRAMPEAPESRPAAEAPGDGIALGQTAIPRRTATGSAPDTTPVPQAQPPTFRAEVGDSGGAAIVPAAPEAVAAASEALPSSIVSSEVAPLREGRPVTPQIETAGAVSQPSEAVAALPSPNVAAVALSAAPNAAEATAPEGAAVASAQLPVTSATVARAEPLRLSQQAQAATAAVVSRPKAAAVVAVAAPAPAAGSVDTIPVPVAAGVASPRPVGASRPSSAQVTESVAEATPTAEAQADTTAITAALALPGLDGPADPVSVAAYQSFVAPDAAPEGDSARDGISGLLGGVACSRLQATFQPDTALLRVTGHVPNAVDRGPILSGLQALMGQSIGIEDNILILPSPQCDALSGIEALGLPQSTDQFTNPLVVGEDTHARAYRYVTDEQLVLDVSAPDYPAYLYVDYFDAAGQVIHLAPNEVAPLRLILPGETASIGAPGTASLEVRIGPPYGQEIAVAFASSVALHSGERPLVEDAATYLDWLRTRIAEARAGDPGFKGEWVYFFVTTAQR